MVFSLISGNGRVGTDSHGGTRPKKTANDNGGRFFYALKSSGFQIVRCAGPQSVFLLAWQIGSGFTFIGTGSVRRLKFYGSLSSYLSNSKIALSSALCTWIAKPVVPCGMRSFVTMATSWSLIRKVN